MFQEPGWYWYQRAREYKVNISWSNTKTNGLQLRLLSSNGHIIIMITNSHSHNSHYIRLWVKIIGH